MFLISLSFSLVFAGCPSVERPNTCRLNAKSVAEWPSLPIIPNPNPYSVQTKRFGDQEDDDQYAEKHYIPVKHAQLPSGGHRARVDDAEVVALGEQEVGEHLGEAVSARPASV